MKKLFLLLVFVGVLSGCTIFGPEEVVESGDLVSLDYVGKFDNGMVFDTSLEEVAEDAAYEKSPTFNLRPDYFPFNISIGAGEVIKDFEEGVIGLKVGETKEITVEPENGYGEWNPENAFTVPRIFTVSIFEEVWKNDLIEETGMTEFLENGIISPRSGRPWNTTIISDRGDYVFVKNDIQNFSIETPIGLNVITRVTGEIIQTMTPELNSIVDTPRGQALISFLNETHFTMDFNHPLAGKTLIFEITVLSIDKVSE